MPEFALSYSVLVIPLLLVGIIVIALRQHQIALQRRQEKGLQWLKNLKSLLSNIQKHRGLSNGYLHGNHAASADLQQIQGRVSQDLRQASRVDVLIEENERWQNITQHWARLAGNFKNLSPENNLTQHNNLIQSVLYLIDDMARQCDLMTLRSVNNKPLHLSWREMLGAAEYIGQARAIGTGVSAAQHCDSVSRIRLNYLCQMIEANTGRLWREIEPSEHQRRKVSDLLTCINSKVIKDTPEISAEDFFALASAALDGLHEQYDDIIKDQQFQQQPA
jgi:hypothetical protein